MTTALEPELESDPYLISLVRGGDTDAFGRLYERHISAARRLARVLTRDPSDSDDLVAETFIKVLSAMRTGHGPDTAFRAYLLTTLRHTLYDRAKHDKRVEYTDDLTPYERPVIADDPVTGRLEASYAARAFARLPERWRAVLWHTEVEGESPAQVAPLLGLTPNGVAALAYRARERLRQMYLQEHIALTESPRCHWTGSHLAGYVRASLARRDRSKVEDHLAECAQCRVLHRELTEENSGLRGVIATILLGPAAPGYLDDAGRVAGGWLAGIAAVLALCWQTVQGWAVSLVAALAAMWHRLLGLPRRLVQQYGGGNVAAASGLVAAGLVGVAVFAAVLVSSDPPQRQSALPLPAPAQPPQLAVPTGPARLTPPTLSYPPPSLPELLPEIEPAVPPAAAAAPAGPAPGPVTADIVRPVLAHEPAATELTAAETGTLPITVRLTESSKKQGQNLELGVLAPAGLKLAASDAGDGWSCRADGQQITCEHPEIVVGGRTVARVPLSVSPGTTGYQEFLVEIKANGGSAKSVLRAPIAPAGMRLAYATVGKVGYGLGGNVLLSCLPRPACLASDNNLQMMAPALPVPPEPGAPGDLTGVLSGEKAASGARVLIPAGAKVRWAGLTLTASGKTAPGKAFLHGPGGKWSPAALKPVGSAGDHGVAQSFTEVTDLFTQSGGGDWWIAVGATDLTPGIGRYAGWSLTVVYDHDSAPPGELAVYQGPKSLGEDQEVSVQLGSGGAVDLGLVLWDGDQQLTGDGLQVDSQQVGTVGNLASGANVTSILCPITPTGCVWRSPGLDVLRHKGQAAPGAVATLRSGKDPLDLGLLTVLTETGQRAGAPARER